MKILQLVSSLGIGGAEKFVVDLSLELVSRGHDVTVFILDSAVDIGKCSYYENKTFKLLADHGVRVIFTNLKRSNIFLIYLKLFKLIHELKPDVVHSHLLIWSLYLSLIPKNFSVIFTQHTNHLKVAIAHKLWLRHRIDSYIAICDEIIPDISSVTTTNKVTKIINGINIKSFTKREFAFEKNKRFTFIAVARLEPVKNIELLLNATELLSKTSSEFQVVIVGDGSQMASLKASAKLRKIDNIVDFVGTSTRVPDFLQKCHVFVLPSIYEGFSLSLIEALASNLKIIATNVGGNAELLNYGQFGILVESNNVNQLKDAMKDMMFCEDQKRFQATDKINFLQSLSIESCCDKHIEVYKYGD